MNQYLSLQIRLDHRLSVMAKVDPSYHRALDAMAYGATIHTGVRKDKVTPEYQHQLEIAWLLISSPALLHPADTLASAFLHDAREDYPDLVTHIDLSERFGSLVADSVFVMDKTGLSSSEYFKQVESMPTTSVVKGADRIHNLQTMRGVFSAVKQATYIQEANSWFQPMLSGATARFPGQAATYKHLSTMLQAQADLGVQL